MRINSLSALAGAAALATKIVPLSNGDDVKVRELSLAQRAEFVELHASGKTFAPFLVCTGVVDDDGEAFLKGQEETIHTTLRPAIVEEIARAVLSASGLARKEGDPGEA